MRYEIKNERTGEVVARSALMANAPWTRMKSLLGKRSLPEGEGIILRPAGSIHTMFMRFAIDVLYLDKEDRLVKLVPDLVPYRFSSARHCKSVIEMASGATAGIDLQTGDQMLFTPVTQPSGVGTSH